jgi:glycosyltransferase involved in cell wall biosynthesis
MTGTAYLRDGEPATGALSRKRVLAFAYACEPDKGGEPGAGWIWARMLGQIADVTVITRENNRPSIEQAADDLPERDHVRFRYVDLPSWMRFWKRGPKGAHAYYFLWQLAAIREALRIRAETEPEIVWHLTWANIWLGSMAALLPARFVYGPVGGGVGTPWLLAPALGWRGTMSDILRLLARRGSRYLNVLARLAWFRADLILVQNPETRDWLPARHRGKAVVFPNVVLEAEAARSMTREASSGVPPTMLFVGRLLPLKGVSLAIRTLALLPEWELLICGDGPDRRRLEALAHRAGVADRVRFLGWISRNETRRLVEGSGDVLIFPSLHDEGGFAVAEALAAGLPVVCLDRGGPPVLGGTSVPATTMSGTVASLADAVVGARGTRPVLFPDMPAQVARLRSFVDGLGTTRSYARIEAPGGQTA